MPATKMSSVVWIPAAAVLCTLLACKAAKKVARWSRRLFHLGAAEPHCNGALLIDADSTPAAEFSQAKIYCKGQPG